MSFRHYKTPEGVEEDTHQKRNVANADSELQQPM
jgi:hypothetical protein